MVSKLVARIVEMHTTAVTETCSASSTATRFSHMQPRGVSSSLLWSGAGTFAGKTLVLLLVQIRKLAKSSPIQETWDSYRPRV